MSELALQSATQVDQLISELLTAEARLEHGYAQLGQLLLEVNTKKYWQLLGFKSFGEYMRSLSEKYNKGRSQLYHYFGTVRELAPYVTEEQMTQMGIAKAAKLAQATKQTGFPPSEEAINSAVNPKMTTQDLARILFEDSLPGGKPEKGVWFNQEGFYVEEHERLVIQSADEAAIRVDPAVPPDAPDWVRRKEARIRQAMEFLATHS